MKIPRDRLGYFSCTFSKEHLLPVAGEDIYYLGMFYCVGPHNLCIRGVQIFKNKIINVNIHPLTKNKTKILKMKKVDVVKQWDQKTTPLLCFFLVLL